MESNVEDQKVTITVFIVENVESKINFFKNEIKTNNIFVNTNFEKKNNKNHKIWRRINFKIWFNLG